MVKNNKLNHSLNALLTNLPKRVVRFFYMKTGSGALREAIGTKSWEHIPADYRPRGNGSQTCKPHLVRYFEFNADATPLGWRSFSKYALIGWCDYVPGPNEAEILPYSEPEDDDEDENVNNE